jgi:hypothetical protein
MIAGCGTSNQPVKETTSKVSTAASSDSSATAVKSNVNEFGWEVPETTMEITFYNCDKNDPDKDAKVSEQMAKYILDKFNVRMTRIVYDMDSKEKLNLMLASNDYPEAIVAMDEDNVAKWKAQGKLQDLTPQVDKIGTDIKKALDYRYKRYLDENGKLYKIPRGWGIFPIPDYSAAIRWDWYTAMGSPKIETPDDYFNVLSQMLAAHPKNSKGEKNYAMSWNQTDSNNFNNALNSYMGIWGLKDGYKEDADHNLTHWLNTSEGLEATKYLNKYTVAGIMDPDAFINKYEDWKQKFSNERILGNINSWWQCWNAGHEVWQKTWKDWKDDQRFVQIALKAPGAEKSYMTAKDSFGWNYTVVTDKCKDVEKLVKWINFNMTPMGERLLCWGVPNVKGQSIWNFDSSTGTWTWAEDMKADLFASKLNYDTVDLNGGTRFSLCEGSDPIADDKKSCVWYDQNFNQEIKWKKIMNDNLKDTIYDNTAAKRVIFSPDNSLTVVKQQIDDSIRTGWAKCVMSKTEAECVSNFNTLRDSLNKAGLHDIEKYRSQEYKKTLDAWK